MDNMEYVATILNNLIRLRFLLNVSISSLSQDFLVNWIILL